MRLLHQLKRIGFPSALVVSGLALSTCAAPLGPVLINGQPVPRLQLEFKGQPYDVHHYDAYPQPGSPSSGLKAQGGRISGVVCGSDIEYSVEHDGDRVRLVGFVDNVYNSHLEISETLGYHTITGNLAYREVKLMLFGDRLRGYVGRCPYDMTQDGDALVQTVQAMGGDMHLRVNGLTALWQLPPADQAAVLPLVMECLTQKTFENLAHENPPAMGFGGEAGSQPPNTIKFTTSRQRDCGAGTYNTR